MRACLWPRCVEYAQTGRSYCAAHQSRRAELGWTGGKRSNAFHRARRVVFARSSGRCEICGAAATIVHHRGRADDDSLENLVALCDACHAYQHRRRLPR